MLHALLWLPLLWLNILSHLFPAETVDIVFAGDAMQHQAQLDAARQPDGTYSYEGYFDAIAPYVSHADYAVVNLETPLGVRNYTGYPCFNAPPAYAQALADAGFDLLLTANNHTLDRRDTGLRKTIELLDTMGIAHIGTYPNAAARAAALPLIRDIGGIKVAFLNYTYGTNGIQIQGDVVVDYIDRKVIAADIKRARQQGAELVCVMPHWGNEYQLVEHQSQRSLADWLIDEQGVEMVIGGHPHVIQPMKMRQRADGTRAIVVYSLGNFVSAMRTADTRGGAMVRVSLGRDAQGRAHVVAANYALVFTVPGTPGHSNFTLLPAESVTGAWAQHARTFQNNAQRIFDTHNRNVNRESINRSDLGKRQQ